MNKFFLRNLILMCCLLSLTSYANDDTKSKFNSSATGTWNWEDKFGNRIILKTNQSGNSVHFQLDLTRSTWRNGEIINQNYGFLDAQFLLNKNIGTYQSSEADRCEISFVFKKSKVIVKQISDYCPFGGGVYANGTLINVDHNTPAFSDGDPRL